MDTLSEAPHHGDGASKPSVGIAQTEKPSDPVHSSCDPLNDSQPTKKRKFDHRNQGSSSQQASNKGKKDKQKRNVGRRRGTRPDGQVNPNEATEEGDEGEKTARLPKRRCALLIGFCGSGYNGMQVQPNVRTIEGELFKALVKAGAVSQDNADDPVKVGLQRAARTDAGVHAAGNVVSIKMITEVPGIPDMLARINEELPPEIRLWSFLRVQGSFNARVSCDSRKYTYFFPSYLLIPPKPDSSLLRNYLNASATATDTPSQPCSLTKASDELWSSIGAGPAERRSRADDMPSKKRWHVGSETVERLREIATKFEGSHNFHNFTAGRDAKDRSCSRFMKKIEIAEPAVYGETEWISVMFHGQSFMLHQIRKMMFILVMSVRLQVPPGLINELYSLRCVTIPKMPSLGLLLEYPIFDSYNLKVAKANAGLKETDADYRPLIDFELHREEIEKFKQDWIYSRMRASEERLEIFDRWQHMIDAYGGNDLTYLNARGIIPDAALFVKGTKRSNGFRERRKFDVTAFPEEGAALAAMKESLEKEGGEGVGVGGEDGIGEVVEEEEEEGEGVGKVELEEMEG